MALVPRSKADCVQARAVGALMTVNYDTGKIAWSALSARRDGRIRCRLETALRAMAVLSQPPAGAYSRARRPARVSVSSMHEPVSFNGARRCRFRLRRLR